jgi:hypothetical protein
MRFLGMRSWCGHAYRLCLAAGILLAAISVQYAQNADRVVAIADIHGDLDSLTALMRKADLIDAGNHWNGGRTTLVQTGDLIDRGPKSRAVLDFLMGLQKEAPRRNGAVRVGLGNHEVMNLIGDLRYVVPEDYAAFSDARSDQRRRAALQTYVKFQAARGLAADEAAWLQAHPLGFIEHREAFGPDGVYGRWIRGLPAINTAGDSVFLHGGLGPELDGWTLDKINSQIRTELQFFDNTKQYLIDKKLALPFFTLNELIAAAQAEYDSKKAKPPAQQDGDEKQHIRILEQLLGIGSWLSVRDDGPLWFRGYDRWTDEEGETRLARLTQALRVKRVVVGHTPQANGEIRARFGGKVFLIDTGMLSSYFKGGQASALEISGGRLRAIYLNHQTELN